MVPITYMNSSADIKAFCGRNGGAVCTSSNAESALDWAFSQHGEDTKVFFLPDQHLGRNTAVLQMGLTLDDCVVWDPRRPNGGLTTEQLRDAKMILWRGHCSVHGRFSPDTIDDLRATIPGINILVHPECVHEVVLKADLVGSTEFIIKTIEAAPAGSAWAVGTELNLVKRLAARPPGQADRLPRQDRLLLHDDEPHRPPSLRLGDGVARQGRGGQPDAGRPRHRALGQVALQRMLDLPGKSHRD